MMARTSQLTYAFLAGMLLFSYGLFAETVSLGHFSWTAGAPGSMSVTVNAPAPWHSCTPYLDGVTLSAGDEIAIFNHSGVCVGATRWSGAAAGITCWGADTTGSVISPGLTIGELLLFRVWDSSAQSEISAVKVHFSPRNISAGMPNADSMYANNGFSHVDSLTAFSPATAPVLTTPSNNAGSQSITVALAWNSVLAATGYGVQVSTTPAFGSTVFSQTALTGTTLSPTGLTYATTYYWRANTTKPLVGTGTWSNTWSFSTILQPPPAPTLTSPTNNAANQPLTLTLAWNSLSTAAAYNVQISQVVNFSSTIFAFNLTATTQSVTLSNGSTYYWRVNASNSGGTGVWSQVWSFSTIPLPPDVPSLSSPTNGAMNRPLVPGLSWNSSTRAASYNVQISSTADFTGVVFNQAEITVLSSTNANVPLYNTTYFWRVRAANGGGFSNWTNAWSFTTTLPMPALSSPSNNAQNQSPATTLSWTSVAGATGYRIMVSTSAAFSSNIFDQMQVGTTASPSGLANGTTYFWRVCSSNSSGTSAWTGTWSFVTIVQAPAVPTLSSPSNGAASQPIAPTLSWSTAARATSYTLQVATVNTFTATVASQSFSVTSATISGLTTNKQYYWRVGAVNAGGTTWSAVWSFSTVPTGIIQVFTSPRHTDFSIRNGAIVYSLATASPVEISFYDVRGRTSQVLRRNQPSGTHTLFLRNCNLGQGRYMVRFRAGNFDKKAWVSIVH